MSKNQTTEDWTLIIKPKSSLFEISLKDIWNYRDLLFLFVKRDLVAVYKQTILGPLWLVIQPVLTTLTFTIIFGNIAKVSTDGLPKVLFYLSGVTIWTYFADCLTKTSATFISNSRLFGKVYFPRMIVPSSIIVSNLIKFSVQFTLFLILLFYFLFQTDNIHPNWTIALLPLLIIIMAGLGLGMGIIISSMTTKYRDLHYFMVFGVQLLMYASPIVYPLSTVPVKYKWIILLNPMTSVIETFKFGFLGAGYFSWNSIFYSIIFMFSVLFIGMIVFNKTEKTFMDTV